MQKTQRFSVCLFLLNLSVHGWLHSHVKPRGSATGKLSGKQTSGYEVYMSGYMFIWYTNYMWMMGYPDAKLLVLTLNRTESHFSLISLSSTVHLTDISVNLLTINYLTTYVDLWNTANSISITTPIHFYKKEQHCIYGNSPRECQAADKPLIFVLTYTTHFA